MQDIQLINYLATETLHDNVVEALAISESLKRIRLTFHEVEMIGHLETGFEIYNASNQAIGDCLRLVPIDYSSGLDTGILCARAEIHNPTG